MANPAKIKAIPIQKTVILINNFVLNTCDFLNVFSESCEKKISVISSKVTELEILLAVLEAKLNSVPGLEYTSADLPSATPAVAGTTSGASSTNPPQSAATAAATAVNPAVTPTVTPVVEDSDLIAAKDHPDYAALFKLLKVGVPPNVVSAKMTAAGLDGSLVDNPDQLIPRTGPVKSAPAATTAPPVEESSSALVISPKAEDSLIAAKDHPDYAPMFKLLKVGVPPQVVAAKLNAAGLDGSLVDTPDALISSLSVSSNALVIV